MANNNPKAPSYLSPEAQDFWRELHEQYDLDARDSFILKAALRRFDVSLKADAALAEEGLTIKAARGARKPNPVATIARAEALACGQLLKMLPREDDDDEPKQDGRRGTGLRP
jgi:phage terminase small subunit